MFEFSVQAKKKKNRNIFFKNKSSTHHFIIFNNLEILLEREGKDDLG